MRCGHCHGEYNEVHAQEWYDDCGGIFDETLCPTCFKERTRKEDLACNSCGYKSHYFKLVKATCYILLWECPKCHSRDSIDSDCSPTIDDNIEEN